MSQFLQTLLPALIPSVIAAIITGYVTARLIPKQFYKQRWWERKAQAYIDALSALSTLDLVTREHLSAIEQHTILSADYRGELEKKRAEAAKTLKTLAPTGGFLVSKPAGDAIRKMFRTLDSDTGTGDAYTETELDFKAVALCLTVVTAEAQDDLDIPATPSLWRQLKADMADHRRTMAPRD